MSDFTQLVLKQKLNTCLDVLEEVQRLLRDAEVKKALNGASYTTRDIAFRLETKIAECLR